MRIALAIAAATLALGLVSRPILGRVQTGNETRIITILMVDAQTGWAILAEPSGVTPLARTTDGGLHWGDVTPLNSSGKKIWVDQIAALSSDIAWVLSVSHSADSRITEIFRTTDGGHGWARSSTTIPTVVGWTNGSNISFVNSREGWFLAHNSTFGVTSGAHGYEDVNIYRSTDGGENWSPVRTSGLPSESGPRFIAFLNSTTGWIAGDSVFQNRLYLYVTHDSGASWQQQNIPLPYELTPQWHASLWAPKFFTPQDGILPALFSILGESLNPTRSFVIFYATQDGGSTWTRARPVSIDLLFANLQQSVADMNHAWVMNGDTLRGTTDGGRSWRMLTQNSLFHNVEQLDFVSPKVGWAVRDEAVHTSTSPLLLHVPPFLLKTLDGGRTWSPVSYTIQAR